MEKRKFKKEALRIAKIFMKGENALHVRDLIDDGMKEASVKMDEAFDEAKTNHDFFANYFKMISDDALSEKAILALTLIGVKMCADRVLKSPMEEMMERIEELEGAPSLKIDEKEGLV